MADPDPRKALEVHRNYLIIAASKNETFAAEACADVAKELKRMQRDFGMSQEMVDGLSEILLAPKKGPRERAQEAAELIGLVLFMSEEKCNQ